MGRPKGSKNKKTLLKEQQATPTTEAETTEELKVASVFFANNLDTVHWHDKDGITPPELEAAVLRAADETMPSNEAIRPLCDLLVEHLESLFGEDTIRQAYFIRHLDDIELRSSKGEMIETRKLPHLHMYLSLQQYESYNKNTTRHSLSQWAEGLYCRKHLVNKVNRGQHDNCLSYLIHIKNAEKIQYDPQDVYTARGTSYLEIWNTQKERWYKGRVTKTKKRVVTEEAVDDLVAKILNGEITKRDLSLNPDYNLVRVYNRGIIDDAFKVVAENRSAMSYTAMLEGKFRKSIFYFAGKAGSCKTLCAKKLIKRIVAWAKSEFDQNWDYYLASEKNPLDDYCGEEIVLLDDIKQDSFTLGGWLKLLDPNNSSNAAARFKNKPDFAPHVVIFTSTQDPFTFFNYVKNRSNENLEQFFRRITKVVDFTNINPAHDHDTLPSEEDIYCSLYCKHQFSSPKKIYLDSIEDAKNQKHADPNYNPFMSDESRRRFIVTSIGFEKVAKYPPNLHPSALCELLLEDVALRHNRQLAYSTEATDSIKQSVWEFTVEQQLGLCSKIESNPFI